MAALSLLDIWLKTTIRQKFLIKYVSHLNIFCFLFFLFLLVHIRILYVGFRHFNSLFSYLPVLLEKPSPVPKWSLKNDEKIGGCQLYHITLMK